MLTEQKRWFYVALPVFFFWFFGQIDKLSISIIQTDPQFLQDLGLTGPNKNALVGLLTLIFTIAYSVSNIFWGVIIDKLGARKTAIIGLSVWTVTMVAGGMAQSYEMFMLSRIILGLGEGMMIPVSAKFISNWFNSREIGRAQASWIIGNYLGPAIGALILTYLITTYSWHESFYVLASFTLFISLPLFMFLARNTPEEHPGVSQKELAHIRLAETTARTSEEKKSFLTNYRYWIVFFGNLMSSFIFFGISIWLPTYLVEAKHFSREAMAGITSLSWMFALCFVILGGFLADKKKRPGLLASIWFILCVLFLTSAYFATNPLIAGVSLGIAMGTQGGMFHLVNLFVVKYSTKETAGKAAGIMGFTNILGGFSSYIMGWMRDMSGGDFTPTIMLLIVTAALGFIAYATTLKKESEEIRSFHA